jgi:hypothetical protein
MGHQMIFGQSCWPQDRMGNVKRRVGPKGISLYDLESSSGNEKSTESRGIFVKSHRFYCRARRDQSGLISVHLQPDIKSEEKSHKCIWHGEVYHDCIECNARAMDEIDKTAKIVIAVSGNSRGSA